DLDLPHHRGEFGVAGVVDQGAEHLAGRAAGYQGIDRHEAHGNSSRGTGRDGRPMAAREWRTPTSRAAPVRACSSSAMSGSVRVAGGVSRRTWYVLSEYDGTTRRAISSIRNSTARSLAVKSMPISRPRPRTSAT